VPLWHCVVSGSQSTHWPVSCKQKFKAPEQALCATHEPPWQTSGIVVLRQRRWPSSHPQLKPRSSRQSGVSPVHVTALFQVPAALQSWALL
jgi:hypothetical protein